MINMRIFCFILLVSLFSCQHKNPHLQTSFNINASAVDNINLKPLQKNILNVFSDQDKKTISALYANEQAKYFLKQHGQKNYPDGSILYLVTWKAGEDPRWFGGNIPDSVISLETVEFNNGIHYTYYEGTPLMQVNNPNADSNTKWILERKVILLP